MVAVAVLASAASAAPAQVRRLTVDLAQTMSQGLRAEREGRYADAAARYRQVLDDRPAYPGALLGLERSLRPLGRVQEMSPFVDAAVTAQPQNSGLREIQFRIAAEVGGVDSVRAAAERWIASAPDSEEPYRMWAFWLARNGDLETARAVLQAGGRQLGPARLAPLDAQLLMASGNWVAAAARWRDAVTTDPEVLLTAAASLRQVPTDARDGVMRTLLGRGDAPSAARRLAGLGLVYWDRPGEGWALLDGALPRDSAHAVQLLEDFAERARRLRTSEGLRARGYALERLAEYRRGAQQVQTRLEAAQAFADAGELGSAQRLLERVPEGGAAPTARDAAATATLIGVLTDAGRLDEAEGVYEEWAERLAPADRRALRERMAWARLVRRDFDRAERVLGDDSTVGAEAVRGWLALYRGRLAEAKQHFRAAGPAAASREEITQRTRMLVLLERVAVARDSGLGASLLALAQGDTLSAARGVAQAAERVSASSGRADLLVFAGQLATGASRFAEAEPLLLSALAADGTGPSAPTALLTLADVYVGLGRPDDAVARLEELIIEHPESAVVPQARRRLDQVRGMIPKT